MKKSAVADNEVSGHSMTKKEQMANSKHKRWLTGGLIFLLTFFTLNILGQLFPYTGLAVIIIYPFILILNGLIIIGTVKLTKNLQPLGYILSWTTTALLTALISMTLFPQEFRPIVFKQITYSISAVRHYDTSPASDLDLPFTVEDFSRHDCKIKDASERYVVALYKYRKTIPLDGSFHIYKEDKSNIIGELDTEIKNIEEIPNKLKTGQEKLIWWTLQKLKK